MNIEIEVRFGKNEHDYYPVKSKSTLNVSGINEDVLAHLVCAMVRDVLEKHEERTAEQEKRPVEAAEPSEASNVL